MRRDAVVDRLTILQCHVFTKWWNQESKTERRDVKITQWEQLWQANVARTNS